MTNYFKVYLQRKDGSYFKQIVKSKEEVRKIIDNTEAMNYYKYIVVRRIKGNTDIPVASGYFSKEVKVVVVDNLETDYKIVAGQVVIDNQGKLIKEKNKEEEER